MRPNQIQKRFRWRQAPKEDNLQCKTTSNGRWLQNMKIWISQQPLIGSSSNFKNTLMRSNQSQKRFRWSQAPMEDDLQMKITSKWIFLNISASTQSCIINFHSFFHRLIFINNKIRGLKQEGYFFSNSSHQKLSRPPWEWFKEILEEILEGNLECGSA